MELVPYVESLRSSLAAAGGAAADDVRAAAERLSYAVEPSLRLTLMEALADAAAEVTAQLDGVAVEVRLRGGRPEMVASEAVQPPETSTLPAPPAPPEPPTPPDSDAGTSRVSLRLPEPLKVRIEEAAAAEGLSVNAWLIRAVTLTLEPTVTSHSITRVNTGRRISGWVR